MKTKTILALLLLGLVGCGNVDDVPPQVVACPASTACGSPMEIQGAGGQTIVVERCGDLTVISSVTGTCCVQGEPADFVPTGTECEVSK